MTDSSMASYAFHDSTILEKYATAAMSIKNKTLPIRDQTMFILHIINERDGDFRFTPMDFYRNIKTFRKQLYQIKPLMTKSQLDLCISEYQHMQRFRKLYKQYVMCIFSFVYFSDKGVPERQDIEIMIQKLSQTMNIVDMMKVSAIKKFDEQCDNVKELLQSGLIEKGGFLVATIKKDDNDFIHKLKAEYDKTKYTQSEMAKKRDDVGDIILVLKIKAADTYYYAYSFTAKELGI
jgi:hypothetical protein